MKHRVIVLAIVLVLLLTACGGTTATPVADSGVTLELAAPEVTMGSDPTVVPTDGTTDRDAAAAAVADAVANAEPVASLATDYPGALTVEAQLALGTVQLEGTDMAVTVAQAETMLPLWQAVQALQASGTAADVEIQSIVKQLQSTMTNEQLGAITVLQLTSESVGDLLQAGGPGFGRNRQGDGQAAPGGVAPGGGFPGGGPGGGQGGGRGAGGGIEGGFDPSVIETRQAEIAESGGLPIDQIAPGVVIRLLQNKTGVANEAGFGLLGTAMAAASEATGLDTEALQSAMAAGQTLRQAIEANGGDVAAAREAIVTALSELARLNQQDHGALADNLLDGAGPANPQP